MINLHFICKQLAISCDRIVEIGANHPRLTHLLPFLKEQNFQSAVLVEAIPSRAQLLRRFFTSDSRIKVLCAAICDVNAEVELYHRGGTTFLTHLPTSPALASEFTPNSKSVKITSNGMTFDRIDDGQIDVLAADIEGAEWYVLKNMISRPKLVCLETHSPSGKYLNPFLDEINTWMHDNAYHIVRQDHSDTVWIRKDIIQ